MLRKKTKIVATIGPVSESLEMMETLAKEGMNVIRLNLSHGSYDEHRLRIKNARTVSQKLKMPLATLVDLPGPKIRIGDFSEGKVTLKKGASITLTTTAVEGNASRVYINYKKLPKEIKPGAILFLDDGKKKLKVKSINGTEIRCTVLVGGEIKGRRGVNIPGAYLSLSSLTATDWAHVDFGIAEDVDFFAISFVRTEKDVVELKDYLKKKRADIHVIAKIETAEAVENLEAIMRAADGVMVARGDLAVEMPREEVPVIQKRIIALGNKIGKPVITATQMLESMITSPVPTRAEVNDVANAIFDGTDAVMLSEETTLGAYPVQAVEIMRHIAAHTEHHLNYESLLKLEHLSFKDVTDSVSYAALNCAHEIGAKAIVALSQSGFTARMIARYQPDRIVVVLTPSEKTYNRLALSFGCIPIIAPEFTTLIKAIEESRKLLKEHKILQSGDRFLIIAGVPFGKAGSSNTLSVQKL